MAGGTRRSGPSAAQLLIRLERLRDQHGAGNAQRKADLLVRLSRARLRTADQVLRLHELLCFLRAYPDSARVLRLATQALTGFEQRADLRAHREALENTGLAGTVLRQALFWPMLRWIAQRWPAQLTLDRDDAVAAGRVEATLAVLLTSAESEWVRERKPGGFEALDHLRGARATDAAFLAHLIEALPGDGRTREAFHDAIEPIYVLAPGKDTPSRTLAHRRVAPLAYQRGALRTQRPDLRAAIATPPARVQRVGVREGERLIELARGAMLTRERDLDAFAYGDARDVRVVHDPDGLAFVLNGVLPERRAPIAAIFGALTLHNGVPIGYIQLDLAGRSAALSFNTFETFRGGEAGHVFARMLAMTHHVFGARSFTIEPYQLGEGNAEGIASGAWWFYSKLGFAPRQRSARALARREQQRAAQKQGYRSSETTLRQLARAHLYFELDPHRPAPLPPLAAIGARVSGVLARLGPDRRTALERCAYEAATAVGLKSQRGWKAPERLAWRRWAPIILSMPGVARWSPAERRALIELVRAKGARSEFDYVQRFLAHRRLAKALLGQSG